MTGPAVRDAQFARAIGHEIEQLLMIRARVTSGDPPDGRVEQRLVLMIEAIEDRVKERLGQARAGRC